MRWMRNFMLCKSCGVCGVNVNLHRFAIVFRLRNESCLVKILVA